MRSVTITLTDFEKKIAESLGRARQKENEKAGVKNRRVGDEGDQQIHIDGAAAELAFARLHNVYPDFGTKPRRGGADCVLCDGTRVDVKTTRRSTGRLIAPVHKEQGDVDVFALMIGEGGVFTYVGWTLAEDLICPERVVPLGKKRVNTYVMEKEMLYDNPLPGERRRG